MDKKRIAAVFVAGMFSINLIGCNSQNVQDAYNIRDSYSLIISDDGKRSQDTTKKTYEDDGKAATISAPDAIFLDADDVMSSNHYNMQILDVQIGDTIYDLYNITDKTEADAAIEWDKTIGPSSGLGRKFDDDGRLRSGEKEQLYFVKCKITNDWDEERWLCLESSIIRGRKADGTVVRLSNEVKGFTGEREKYDYFNKGRGGEYRSVRLKAHEEKTLVLICSYTKNEYVSNERGTYAADDKQITTYITSEILDGVTSIPYSMSAGVKFLPIFINGMPVHN